MSMFPFAIEHLLTKEQSHDQLSPIFPEIASVWHKAFKTFLLIPPAVRSRLGKVPTANPVILNALAQTFADDVFYDREDEGIRICDAIPQVFAFYYRDTLIRFNRLGQNGVVGNLSKSELKNDYFNQRSIREIDPATRLTAGYRLNEAGSEIQTVEISLQVGDTLVYRFPIDEPDSMQLPQPTKHPTPASPNGTARSKYRAR